MLLCFICQHPFCLALKLSLQDHFHGDREGNNRRFLAEGKIYHSEVSNWLHVRYVNVINWQWNQIVTRTTSTLNNEYENHSCHRVAHKKCDIKQGLSIEIVVMIIWYSDTCKSIKWEEKKWKMMSREWWFKLPSTIQSTITTSINVQQHFQRHDMGDTFTLHAFVTIRWEEAHSTQWESTSLTFWIYWAFFMIFS